MTGPASSAAAAVALTAALEAEQVAAFGYGTLGPRLSAAAQVSLARSCEQAHQQLAAASADLLGPPTASRSPVPLANYAMPIQAVDVLSAQQLALALEQSCASAWRYVLAQLARSQPSATGSDPTWPTIVAALTDSAVRAVQWRRLIDPDAPSTAFPGI